MTKRESIIMSRVSFLGDYTAKVDDKGRVVFPSQHKSRMPEGADMTFVLHKSIYSPCLEMFTLEEWESQTESVKAKLDFFNEQHAEFWDAYLQGSAFVTPDPKLGRILIPKELQEEAGLTKEVVFAGRDFKIEIWDKDAFESSRMSKDRYKEIARGLSQTR